ncbi:DUF192 domain-containing protein [Ectothiorhodospiraceae bacterium 2226]|nr:DUF192 domain-containing protein [Ectothiorhodospiraceae bacterium 2226]
MRSTGCWRVVVERNRAAALLLALLLGLGANALAASERAVVGLADTQFRVEVVREPPDRERGLMFRDTLPPGTGMLFVIDPSEPVAFWMKNVRFPLDILYFDDRGRLVEVAAEVPPCRRRPCPVYPSPGPVRYVLELPAGEAARLGLAPGAPLHLRNEP